MDSVYAKALSGDRDDMQMLRLMQRTGCVWPQLSQATAAALLAAFAAYVHVSVGHRPGLTLGQAIMRID